MTLPHDATAERYRTAHSSERSTLVRAEVHPDADFADLVDAPIKILLRPRWRRNDFNWFDVPGGATLALRFSTTAAMGPRREHRECLMRAHSLVSCSLTR